MQNLVRNSADCQRRPDCHNFQTAISCTLIRLVLGCSSVVFKNHHLTMLSLYSGCELRRVLLCGIRFQSRGHRKHHRDCLRR